MSLVTEDRRLDLWAVFPHWSDAKRPLPLLYVFVTLVLFVVVDIRGVAGGIEAPSGARRFTGPSSRFVRSQQREITSSREARPSPGSSGQTLREGASAGSRPICRMPQAGAFRLLATGRHGIAGTDNRCGHSPSQPYGGWPRDQGTFVSNGGVLHVGSS